jgi:hypothetical protein
MRREVERGTDLWCEAVVFDDWLAKGLVGCLLFDSGSFIGVSVPRVCALGNVVCLQELGFRIGFEGGLYSGVWLRRN